MMVFTRLALRQQRQDSRAKTKLRIKKSPKLHKRKEGEGDMQEGSFDRSHDDYSSLEGEDSGELYPVEQETQGTQMSFNLNESNELPPLIESDQFALSSDSSSSNGCDAPVTRPRIG